MTTTHPARRAAAELPVARVAVDIPLAHLDRPFDYLVSEADSDAARPGVRVRVRFAGRRVNGFILERRDKSEHGGRLALIDKVVSPRPVLTREVAELCRAVADRYAGTMADVLRLAVPPRRAAVDKEAAAQEQARVAGQGPLAGKGPATAQEPAIAQESAAGQRLAGFTELGADAGPRGRGGGMGDVMGDVAATTPDGWLRYPAATSFRTAVRDGRPARAAWQALPGEDWPTRLAELASAAAGAERGALIIVPDARDVARLDAALMTALGAHAYLSLTADLGPTERYRRFVAIAQGRAQIVIGTRAAAFAPVQRLGLVAVFDDGDDLLAEPRAPYPHARDVLMLRSVREHAAMLVGGFARTAETQLLVRSGWAKPIAAERATVREHMPRIEAAEDHYAAAHEPAAAGARLSAGAFSAARAALTSDRPVLVQVPRRGYVLGLACRECRRPARCSRCSGPLAVQGSMRAPSCRWCGVAAARWACPACGANRLRGTVMGSARTAEEIGRAFAGVRLRTSSAGKVLERVPAEPAIVVATPGAEPVADGGYGAALLLDGGLLLGRADLRASEETLRRWMAAATLVRPAADGGRVVVGAAAAIPTVQALVRWDPAWHAEQELSARSELGFPPTATVASLQGVDAVVAAAVDEVRLPDRAEVLGPVPLLVAHVSGSDGGLPGENASGAGGGPQVRTLLRVPSSDRAVLTAALQVLAAARSTRKDSERLRIEVDPTDLG